jgi:uncharacterized protein YcbK (DUF882 family)/LysM repeat protein
MLSMRCDFRAHLRASRLICLAGACLALAFAPDASAETTHVVGPGHTLAKIAKRYHVSVAALREANNLAPGQKLKPGQRVIIPDPGSVSDAPARGSRAADSRAADSRDEEYDSSRDDRASRSRGGDAYSRKARPTGTVVLMRGSQRWTGKTVARGGKLAPAAAEAFKRMLRDESARSSHAIDPRLISIVTQVSDHFGGRPIEVVSGFRAHSDAQFTAHSNHNVGKAIDFVIRGVPNEVLRDYCHGLSDVGVGYYPNSSFIHLDVRSATAHWVDESKPGDPPQYSSVTGSGESAKEASHGRRSSRAKDKSEPEATSDVDQ